MIRDSDYVIDTLKVWDSVPLLAPVFANPAILKVAHAIPSCDVPVILEMNLALKYPMMLLCRCNGGAQYTSSSKSCNIFSKCISLGLFAFTR